MSVPQIFISYANDQSHGYKMAIEVQQQLQKQGYQVFRDESGVAPGTHWALELETQLENSQLMILVMSEKVRRSEWVLSEFDLAKELKIPVIPVMAESVRTPLWLRHLQMMDFCESQDWKRLLASVNTYAPLPQQQKTTNKTQTSTTPKTPVKDAPSQIIKPDWASHSDKDQFGTFADLTLKNVTQCFRLIPSGEFLIGSSETEEGRFDWEDQHKVTLSNDFWMADTACTQELWQVVMGENPSHFKGDQRPVESVSWDNIQEFLKAVKQLKPKLDIKLPTEAQWEYACRAGTTTAFNLGDEINTQQVNFLGKTPKEETVEVKSMQSPNQWGLHEMHGNVWEWCQDSWERQLGDKPATAVMKNTGADRVFRGGSWLNSGRDVRSAYRNHSVPSFRDFSLGFRLLLGL